MARPPKIKRLSAEEYAGAPAWFAKFLDQMNGFLNDANQCFGNGLTFGDNFAAGVATITVRAPDYLGPSYNNGWKDYDAVARPGGYFIDAFGRVSLRGGVAGGTVGTPAGGVFVLPQGYAPTNVMVFVVNATDAFGKLRVDPDGTVYIIIGTNTFVFLDGISWQAKAPVVVPSPFPLYINSSLSSPQDVRVGRVKVKSGQPPTGPVEAKWLMDSRGRIQINGLSGLAPGSTYEITLVYY